MNSIDLKGLSTPAGSERRNEITSKENGIAMLNAAITIDPPQNETTLAYAPGSPERRGISTALSDFRSQEIDIPLIIGGREVRTARTAAAVARPNGS